MNEIKHDVGIRLVKGLNVFLMVIPVALCWYLYYADVMQIPFYRKGNWLLIALYMLLYYSYAGIYDAFMISYNRISEMIYSQVLAAVVSDGIFYIVICLLIKGFPSVWPEIAALAAQSLFSGIWSLAAHNWYYRVFPPKKSAIIYDVREGLDRLIGEYGLEKKFKVQWTAQVKDCLDEPDRLKSLDTVFLSGIHSHDRNILLKYCIQHGVSVYVIPRIGDVIMSGAKKMHMFHLPMLRVERYNPTPEYRLVKRFSDIVISITILFLTSPILLVIALAIKLYDRGPVFYCQKRLTKNGKEFQMRKFRSMSVDAEKDGVARLSTGAEDERVTPVGRMIRKFHLDELPQFFNILQGDMSIVGPRPERPEIAVQYEKEMPEFRLRLQVKAGLTGYAQVYGKYDSSPYDKLQMDLMYIASANMIEDIRICFATVKTMFMPEHAGRERNGER